jgi:hypothetical protein
LAVQHVVTVISDQLVCPSTASYGVIPDSTIDCVTIGTAINYVVSGLTVDLVAPRISSDLIVPIASAFDQVVAVSPGQDVVTHTAVDSISTGSTEYFVIAFSACYLVIPDSPVDQVRITSP